MCYPPILKVIKEHLGKILRLPGNALAAADVISMQFLGGYNYKSMQALSLASLMRASLVTLTTWQHMHSILRKTAVLYKPMVQLFKFVNGVHILNLSPSWWDSEA